MRSDLQVHLSSPSSGYSSLANLGDIIVTSTGIPKTDSRYPLIYKGVAEHLLAGDVVSVGSGLVSYYGFQGNRYSNPDPVDLAALLNDMQFLWGGYLLSREQHLNPSTKKYVVGVARSLPVCDGYFNASEAKKGIFRLATGPSGKFSPREARKGFLLYDSSAPNLRGSYKLPIAMAVGGELVVVGNGVRNALSRLPQTHGVSEATADRARQVLETYLDKVHVAGACPFSVAH